MSQGKWILVTGANGYIGGCLIPRLFEEGYRVRCLVRDQAQLRSRAWYNQVEIIECDLLDCRILAQALEGVSAAYYLVHNMSTGQHYQTLDLTAAANFASAASTAGVQQIIYLGGLADPHTKISAHMRSRIQTGNILRQGTVPVTEFRASLVIGPGSISFEMIRFLTEQFPLLAGPAWLHNRAQPIATQNVLDYLLAALDTPACKGQIIEIGGPDVLTYAESMLEYARLRGLKRRLLTVPGVPVRLMAYVVEKLSPISRRIAAPLIGGMSSDSIIQAHTAGQLFPAIQPLGYRQAVSLALSQLSPAQVEPIWNNRTVPVIITKHAGFLIDFQQISVKAAPAAVYQAFTCLGGKRGWLYQDWLWKLRGGLDRILGGPGMRGRQDEHALNTGAVVDFYRVEALEPGHLLRLRAELKAPGEGWMQWQVKPHPDEGSLLYQIAFFAPKGMLGFLYWYLLFPVHRLVFAGLIQRIARQAIQTQQTS